MRILSRQKEKDISSQKLLAFFTFLVVCLFASVCSVSAENDSVDRAGHLLVPAENETYGAVYEPIPDNASGTLSNNPSDDNITMATSLPSSVNLSTSKYFPPIRNQYGGSCASWASTYYQFTYEAAKLNNWDAKHDDSKVFSPKYTWNYLNEGKDIGVSRAACYQLLEKQGALRWSEFPQNSLSFDWYQGSSDTQTINTLRNALKTRVTSYSRYVFSPWNNGSNGNVPVVTSNTDADLTGMKQVLNSGHVLTFDTFACNWYYETLSNGEYGVLYATERRDVTTKALIGHAMTIVGYNDNIYFDYNQNGTVEPAEKGAFLVANSWGTNATKHNQGYIWVMYDALNSTSNFSSYNGAINGNNRRAFIENDSCDKLEVANYNPQLMAEVTVQQKVRNDFSISLGRSDLVNSSKTTQTTFLNGIGGTVGFNGSTSTAYQSRIFVFDYDTLYNGNDNVYWISVTDLTANNGANTTVQKIRWVNSNGTVVKQLGQQSALNGTTGSYNSNVPVTKITLNKSSSQLSIGKTETLSATITPSDATRKALTWSSSNTNVATVDGNGKVTAVGKGTAIITATATDGSGVSASCTYTVVKLVNSITLNKTSSTLLKGKSEQLTATVLPTDASNRSVTWSSSNTSVVKVSSTGLVTYVGKGTATVTATAKDGSGIKASCTYTITDDYGNTIGTAYTVTLHSKTSGGIDASGDVDYFKFTPTSSGTYIIYTTGSTDTKGYLYNASQTQLAYSDDASISGRNFALKYNLTAGATYYIYVGAYSTYTGTYTLEITKGVYSASLASYNQDARRVQMQAEASTILTQLEVHIGNTTYVLKKPSSGSLDATVNGARFKVTFTTKNNGLSTVWTINAKIPATATGSTQSVYFEFSKGKITDVNSSSFTGFVAYASSMKTGIDPDSNLQAVLNDMAQSGYEFEVRDWDDTLINVTSSTKAATGMKIIKTKVSTGKIVEVYYVVLFGDVSGNGDVGDGVISSVDSMNVLSYSTGKIILSDISKLAADVDHNGEINSADSLTILQASTKKVIIDQDYAIAEVPDFCYFLDPVAF